MGNGTRARESESPIRRLDRYAARKSSSRQSGILAKYTQRGVQERTLRSVLDFLLRNEIYFRSC